jgi:CubicO group peptidase (beta-lactamase class C family)
MRFFSAKTPDISGDCLPEFYPVRDVFYHNLKSGRDRGAALSVSVDGEKVLDLWAGSATMWGRRQWQADTLTNIFSCTKSLSALCVLRLVDQGKLALDVPVAEYWSGFEQQGKADITLRSILGHRAGLPAIRSLLMGAALIDSSVIEQHLESSPPWWAPNSHHGYHALSLGWLLGKVVREVTGQTIGQYFSQEFAQPLGLDIHIGTPVEHYDRISRPILSSTLFHPHRDVVALARGVISEGLSGMTLRAFANPLPLGLHAALLTQTWARIEQPAGNAMSTARDLARLFGLLASGGVAENGYVLLSEQTLPLCWQELSSGPDLVLKRDTRFSHGFMMGLPGPLSSFGPGARNFGHNGLGGTLAVADPDRKMGFAYVTNHLGNYVLVDPRARALLDATYASI